MASTRIEDLVPAMQPLVRELLKRAEAQGYDLRITAAYRSNEEQEALYALGRTQPGSIVTYARAGQSYHNLRRAVDVVDRVRGYSIDWEAIGRIGESLGLVWGGRWTKLQDKPHFEYHGPEREDDTMEQEIAQLRAQLETEKARANDLQAYLNDETAKNDELRKKVDTLSARPAVVSEKIVEVPVERIVEKETVKEVPMVPFLKQLLNSKWGERKFWVMIVSVAYFLLNNMPHEAMATAFAWLGVEGYVDSKKVQQ